MRFNAFESVINLM